jgi:hypothetical protein
MGWSISKFALSLCTDKLVSCVIVNGEIVKQIIAVMIRLLLLTFLLGVLTACNLSASTPPTPTLFNPVAPNVRIAQSQTTPLPTEERQMRVIPTNTPISVTPTSQFVSSATTCDTAPEQKTQYEVVANVDYAQRTLDVSQRIHYVNRTTVDLDTLVLNIEPNNIANAFTLQSAQIGQIDVNYALDRNHITINLPEPLTTNCDVVLDLQFQIKPPQINSGIAAFRGYFGYSPRQINLAHWLPKIVPYRGMWLINTPSSIGENIVLEQADWDVRFNMPESPANMKLAAPGVQQSSPPNQWHYILNNARDFPVSMSEFFNVSQMTTSSGVSIEVYTFPDAILQTDEGIRDGAAHVLQEASRSFAQYESLFGDYPYERFLVVQGDFPDGMEFSGLVFVSTSWFYSFPGGAANYLTLITVHEVSHQWWYARVGNDAAQAPWLDEALATYSEYIYFEEYYPDLKNWWWTFRVANFYPQGNVDSTVYEFANIRDYINAVYLRGVQMLHNLREDIGTDAFFDLLNRYANTADGDIATSELFWSLLSRDQYESTQQTRLEFLRHPDVLPAELLGDQ